MKIYSSCFKIPEAEHASVASRSGCSGAKPTAHTGFGITYYSKLIIFVTIIWLILSQSEIVRSQPAPQYPYPYPNLPVYTQPESPANYPQLPTHTTTNLTPNLNPNPTPNGTAAPQFDYQTNTRPVAPNRNTRRSSIFSPFFRKKQPANWQQTAKNSFVGRNLRGTEIFGGQIEPSTNSTGNFFTTIETFTYNRNSVVNSEINGNVLKFNVTSLFGKPSYNLQSLPASGSINTSAQYALGIETPPSYMRDEVVTFLGKVANGTASVTDFDITVSPSLIEYAKNYGIDPSRVEFDSAQSQVKFQNPIGGTYNHAQDLQDAQITYDFLAKYKVPYNIGNAAYGLGRQKAADNMTITPTNRIIFDHNYFHNVQFTQDLKRTPIQINRFTIGFEKTLLNDLASIEIRVPLAVTTNNQLSLFGENDVDKLRLGDMTVITKYVLFERRHIIWTTGIGFSLPLAEDSSIIDYGSGNDIIRWKNRTIHFMPYLGVSVVPDDRLFFNAVLQGDGAAIGDSTYIADLNQPSSNRMISIGKTYDRSYLYTTLAIGYWLRRQEIWNNRQQQNYTYNGQAPSPNYPYINPIIPTPQPPKQSNWAMNFTTELHWTQSVKKLRGIYHQQGNYLFDIGNDSSSYHAVDMTFGTRLLFNKKTSLGVGYTVPLTGHNRQYDGELRATFNRYF
ncbi:MAG: hypothetical protein LBJ00_06085 [Planctomycetaceae bacterium]|jgi:hypothetical protein|nr:hypothetical protein [Planctomycetaceae bacterium]